MELQNIYITIVGILISTIIAILNGKRYVKTAITYLQEIFYIFKYRKVKSFASNLLNRKVYIMPILDEMIGFFQSSHIGIYTFHNGTVSLDNQHLLKTTMIDERSRYFSIIRENQSIPLSIYTDIILHCVNNNYYELNVNNTDIIFLKEQFKLIPTVHFVYYTSYWNENTPEFLLSICTHKQLTQEQLDKIFEYKITLKKIINQELEETKYKMLYE